MLEVHRDCIGFASKRHEIGQHEGNLKPPQSQSDDRTKPNRDLVTRVLPRYRPVSCIDTDFSLASCEIIMKDFYGSRRLTTLWKGEGGGETLARLPYAIYNFFRKEILQMPPRWHLCYENILEYLSLFCNTQRTHNQSI